MVIKLDERYLRKRYKFLGRLNQTLNLGSINCDVRSVDMDMDALFSTWTRRRL